MMMIACRMPRGSFQQVADLSEFFGGVSFHLQRRWTGPLMWHCGSFQALDGWQDRPGSVPIA